MKVKEIAKGGVFSDGDWVESKDQDINGNIRLIQLADIGDGYFIDKSKRFMNEETTKRLNCTFLEKNDILIARMPDPIGRCCLFPFDKSEKFVTAVDVCILRIKSNNSKEYIKHAINSPFIRRKIESQVTGTTRLRITKKKLGELEIPLPPIEQQKKIAAILDAADALRQKDKALIAKYDELAQSLFLDMFGDDVGTEYLFGDLSDKSSKGTFSNGPFGSDLLTSELTDKGVPVIYIRDIRNGQFNWKSDVYITESKAEYLKNCQVLPNDVLIAKVGDPPGTAAVYPSKYKMGVITQDVVRLRVDPSIVSPKFIQFWFNSHIGQKHLQPIIVEGTRKRFGLGDLKKTKIFIPNISLQNQFAERVRTIEEQKAIAQASAQKSEELFNSLLQRAFSGELFN